MGHIKGASREQVMMITLEDIVSKESLARIIDAFVEGTDLKELGFTHATAAKEGRPSYDPGDLLKVVLYGPYKGIFSSYQLNEACRYNLEAKWLAQGLMPCAKTFSEFRRQNSEGIKGLFKALVDVLGGVDLFDAELEVQDGSKVDAQNSKSRNYTKTTLEKRHEYLSGVAEAYERALRQESESAESAEATGRREAKEEPERSIPEGLSREEKETNLARYREKIEACTEMQEQLEASGERQLSLTDPDARRMPVANGGMEVCYNMQVVADAKHSLIAAYEVINTSDAGQLSRLSQVAMENLHVDHIEMLADQGYNSATDLLRCETQGVKVQLSDKEGFDICIECTPEEAATPAEHTRGKCVYLEERNIVVCPMGQVLLPGKYRDRDQAMRFYNSKACKACCCKCVSQGNKEFEVKMTREQSERTANVEHLHVKQHHFVFDPEQTKRRESIIEHIFGTIKHGWGMRQFLSKGLGNVNTEAGIACMTYNLLRARNILGYAELIGVLHARAQMRRTFFLSGLLLGRVGAIWCRWRGSARSLSVSLVLGTFFAFDLVAWVSVAP